MHWRATAHSARCTIKGITDVLPAFATRANSESVKRHDIMAVGVDRARDCSALFVFSAESTVYTSYSHRKLSRLVSATLLYGSCHASLQYAVGARAAGKMTSRCRMSSSAPWCENIASMHCLEPCWSTIIAGERLPYARRGPKQSAVGGQPEPSSAPSESRGRGVPTEAWRLQKGEVEGLLL